MLLGAPGQAAWGTLCRNPALRMRRDDARFTSAREPRPQAHTNGGAVPTSSSLTLCLCSVLCHIVGLNALDTAHVHVCVKQTCLHRQTRQTEGQHRVQQHCTFPLQCSCCHQLGRARRLCDMELRGCYLACACQVRKEPYDRLALAPRTTASFDNCQHLNVNFLLHTESVHSWYSQQSSLRATLGKALQGQQLADS